MRVYARSMRRLVRIALLLLLTFLTLGVVVAIGSAETGPAEKLVLLPAVVGLCALAVPVRRLT